MPVRFTPAANNTPTPSRGRTAAEAPLKRRRPISSHGSTSSTSLLKPPESRPRSRSQEDEARSVPTTQRRPEGPSRKSSHRSSVSPRAHSPSSRSPRPARLSRRSSFDSDTNDAPAPAPSRASSTRVASRERQRPAVAHRPASVRQLPPRLVPLSPRHPSPPYMSGGGSPLGAVSPYGQLSPGAYRPSTPTKYKPRDYFGAAVATSPLAKERMPQTQRQEPLLKPEKMPQATANQKQPTLLKPLPAEKPCTSQKQSTPPRTNVPKPESAKPPKSAGDFLSKVPRAINGTFAGLQSLNEHASTAKEWAAWLNDLRGAPEEMQSLSARAATARDTVTQIQASVAARPDLVQGEHGAALKTQIEDAIRSTNAVLATMTTMLEDLSRKGAKEATVWSGLEDFYNSYRYKSEFEDKVKKADEDLQRELGMLSTLMVNIYSRAIMKPTTAETPTPVPPAVPQSPVKEKETFLPKPKPDMVDQKDTPAVKVAEAPKASISKEQPDPEPSGRRPSTTIPDRSVKFDGVPPSPSTIATEEATIGTQADPIAARPATPYAKLPQPSSNETPREPLVGDAEVPPSADTPEDVLLDAAWAGDLDAVAQALRHAAPSACDVKGLTALHLASERDHLAVAILLLDRGASAAALANGRRTPLHLAARTASASTVEVLLERGRADVNGATADGRTPLHYAASAAADGDEERREVLRVLRDAGADPTARDRKGRSPRDVAQARDYWDAAATLRRAERKWEEEHRPNWLQRHGFMK